MNRPHNKGMIPFGPISVALLVRASKPTTEKPSCLIFLFIINFTIFPGENLYTSKMNILAALFCVFMFSLTAPFTRLAALEVSAESIILIRILGAGIVCFIFAVIDRWIPPRKAWPALIATAAGSVIGFNSLMAYGLREVPSGHAAVALAGLPMATSVYSILRDRLNPGLRFWFFALAGTLMSFGFFFILNIKDLLLGDFLLLLSVLSAAFGYVEGGRISRIHGGRRVMSWAVLITLPIVIPLSIFYFNNSTDNFSDLNFSVWFSFSYLALISQSLGMFLWFKVLAKGPMEKVALVQLIQPFFTLLAAIIILNEKVAGLTWVVAGLVAMCVVGSNKERQKLSRVISK
jgi:drug/metabolite transporter (DMT)-like permease